MSSSEDVKKLLTIYTRRLQKLKEQKAKKGINTEPEVLIEIEDVESEIENLQGILQNLEHQSPHLLDDYSDLQIKKTSREFYLQNAIPPLNLSIDVYGPHSELHENSLAYFDHDRKFSESITNQMAQVNKIVETLTVEQYTIIHFLRGHRRARIAGSAGSGKTLVAAEKAIRLDNAGINTLVLCHNPNLAQYIRKLTSGTSVTVFDFVSWINILLFDSYDNQKISWMNYYEPLDTEIDEAINVLSNPSNKFEAIIVDEAQDFRESWWKVIENALLSPTAGILYLFHDDNQALLPGRSKYPIPEAPFSLSKNCRNAGNIFQVVRHFHGTAPQGSPFLAGHGMVHQSVFEESQELSEVKRAIQQALKLIQPNEIVVLTTEFPPVDQSILNGLIIDKIRQWRWQDAVEKYLKIMGKTRLAGLSKQYSEPENFPKLSEDLYPNREDIDTVANFARGITAAAEKKHLAELGKRRNYKWYVRSNGLVLRLKGRVNPVKVAAFFSSSDWAEGIPKPEKYQLDATDSAHTTNDLFTINLYDIATFKGLEATAIILFIRSPRDDLTTHLYVGLSRARFYLHIITDKYLYSQFQQNAWFRNLLDLSQN